MNIFGGRYSTNHRGSRGKGEGVLPEVDLTQDLSKVGDSGGREGP